MIDKKAQAQKSFGQHAQNYVTSQSHARGDSLAKLIEALQPQAEWQALDISTGGGHVALALGKLGVNTIASDLTLPMLGAARRHHHENELEAISYVQHDAEKIPFSAAYFDLVTCRIAPHHFLSVETFVMECARVLKPDGLLGVVDIISPEQAKVARYCNLFETLRDNSHVWAYSLGEWEHFFERAGLQLQLTERVENNQNVGTWARMLECDDQTIERLRAMLLQAPQPVREWYKVKAELGLSRYVDIPFAIQQAILVARKSS